jgi:hypothetical protein
MGIRSELELRLPNSPGAAAFVFQQLAEQRINLIAMSLDTAGRLRLVTDNHSQALSILQANHHVVVEHEVLLISVANRSGNMASVLGGLRDAGANVNYAYTATADGWAVSFVVGVDDVMRVAAAAGL